MAKSSGLNFNLPSVDDLFSTEEERAEARLFPRWSVQEGKT